MARSRNIKPGYFLNVELSELQMAARILFAGLWCIADRAGRLEDKAKKIKIQTLPYDDVDIDALLNDLQEAGFIIRYSADGEKYIQVINFSKHQNPHKNEAESAIPPYVEGVCEKYSTSTVQVPEMHSTNRADSLNMIPDSLNLIINEKGNVEKDNCPYQEIIDLYHSYCPKLPKVIKLTTERKKHIHARWIDNKQSLDAFITLFKEVRNSPFLCGSTKWQATFDWLMKESNMVKVLEGNYINKPSSSQKTYDDVPALTFDKPTMYATKD